MGPCASLGRSPWLDDVPPVAVQVEEDGDRSERLVPRLLREAVEKGIFEEQVTLQRKDGGRFPAILTVRPMFRDGKQIGFMGRTRPLAPPKKA